MQSRKESGDKPTSKPPSQFVHDQFRYRHAIVRGIPDSFVKQSLRMHEPSVAIDLKKAQEQHAKYTAALQSLGVELIQLPADNSFPDCVFVEDTAVVAGTKALICNLGHPSRRGEVAAIAEALSKHPNMQVVKMPTDGGATTMDGGDVLFTGEEFFVGASSRTTQKGIDFLRATFPEYPVSAIPVTEGLHLKSVMSMCGPRLVAVANTTPARQCWDAIHRQR